MARIQDRARRCEDMNPWIGQPHLRIFTGVITLWAAMQTVFLLAAFSSPRPSDTAHILSTHHQLEFVSSLAFHSFAVLFFGVVASIPVDVWRRIEFKYLGLVATPYIAIILALTIIFVVSIAYPKYEVFVDLSTESVVKRDTHLLPSGLNQQTILFGEMLVIAGYFDKHTHLKSSGLTGLTTYDEYHYMINLIAHDGRQVEVWRGSPPQGTDGHPPAKALRSAQALADITGAPLVPLGCALPQCQQR